MRQLSRTSLIGLAVLLAAGCSSADQPGGPPSLATGMSDSGTATISAGNSPSSSSPGGVRQPAPAPSDSDGLQVSGPVAVRLLSRSGPLQPAGPYLASNLAALLGRYRAELGGSQPSCPVAGCWTDATIPPASVLLALRPATVACYQLLSIKSSQPGSGAIELDLQLNYTCRPGAGSAARMASWLLALPAGALAPGDRVTVRASLRPGTGFSTLGEVTR